MLSSFRLIGLVARLVSPGPGLVWQQGTPSPPLPVVYEALPMVHKMKMKMDIQDISYFECFKCHQKCLQTNSIILKLFSEKEVLIFWWHIQRQMDCKCTTFDKYKLSQTRSTLPSFPLFVGTRLGARGHNQSITVIDTEVMRVHITCYVAMGGGRCQLAMKWGAPDR